MCNSLKVSVVFAMCLSKQVLFTCSEFSLYSEAESRSDFTCVLFLLRRNDLTDFRLSGILISFC